MLVLQSPKLDSQTRVNAVAAPGSRRIASASLSKVAAIKGFRIVQETDGSAVEVLSTAPLIPSIQAFSHPDRLVIDLPNARLDTREKQISVEAHRITAIRADQLQKNPPLTRLVVELQAPRSFTWDAAGNRLLVHLGGNPVESAGSSIRTPAVPSLTSTPQAVVTAVRAAGPLTLAGNSSGAGSSITAGPETAVINLSSGGEVHVCPGTTVSVTPSHNRHNIMLGMNTGALEAHLALDASSDSVMTPDFRILLVGPGEFHYAISADSQGNTCVRALPGNTASAIVNELLGDRTYQVKATDQLVFRSGQLDRVDMAVPLECGCPPPREGPLRATNNLPMQNAPSAAMAAVNANLAADAEASNELHVQVEAPFVFHATGPSAAPMDEVGSLPLDSRSGEAPALAAPLPPPANDALKPVGTETAGERSAPVRGFFRKVGGFFAALFR